MNRIESEFFSYFVLHIVESSGNIRAENESNDEQENSLQNPLTSAG